MKLAAGILTIVMLFQGCSIYKAAHQEPPCPVEKVKVGCSRTEVMGILGSPEQSEVVEGQRTDVYEFVDGLPGSSKSRILLYLAGDVFTVGLAELVFWPMEETLLDGREGRAVVIYSPDNVAENVTVTKKNGSPWVKEVGDGAGAAEQLPVQDETPTALEDNADSSVSSVSVEEEM
jgi:hypothetical protein